MSSLVSEDHSNQNDASTTTTTTTLDSDDRIVQSIYNNVISRVCIDVACNMHGLVKTGAFPMSALKEPSSRQEIYPELYKDQKDEEVQATLEKYSTEVPKLLQKRSYSEMVDTEGGGGGGGGGENTTKDIKDIAASTTTIDGGGTGSSQPDPEVVAITPTMQTRHSVNHLDIWGRIPPREPKQTCECQVCGRHVSTLRFAPHLDKCMGISARGTPNNGSGARTGSF
jgi:hypothetical protein